MNTDRYAARPIVNPGGERRRIPTSVYDLAQGKALDIHQTHTQAVKVVKRLNKDLREDE